MKTLRRSHEPVTWSLFGAGGMVLAYLTPALLTLTALVLPLVWIFGVPGEVYATLRSALSSGWMKAELTLLIALQALHAAHRIYHGLHDLHVPLPSNLLFALVYGLAALLTLVGGGVLLGL